MSDKTIQVSKEIAAHALVDKAKYDEMYARSLSDPDGFWGEHGKRIDWIEPYSKVMNVSYDPENLSIKWYEDGVTNVAVNCIDRHLETRGDQVAIIWEGDEPKDSKEITYKELHGHVCRLSNALKDKGVKKGDTVTIYMPMIPEAAYAMLACARIGAVHSVVFGGFSPDSLANRIKGCSSKVVITADEGYRGAKKIPLKKNTDEAIEKSGIVETVFVVKRTGGYAGRASAGPVPPMKAGRQRLDKWLWFARFARTRSLAAKLVAAGHVRINGTRADDGAKGIGIGDVVTVAAAHGTALVRVVDLGERRGPAPEARTLYAEVVGSEGAPSKHGSAVP